MNYGYFCNIHTVLEKILKLNNGTFKITDRKFIYTNFN